MQCFPVLFLFGSVMLFFGHVWSLGCSSKNNYSSLENGSLAEIHDCLSTIDEAQKNLNKDLKAIKSSISALKSHINLKMDENFNRFETLMAAIESRLITKIEEQINATRDSIDPPIPTSPPGICFTMIYPFYWVENAILFQEGCQKS